MKAMGITIALIVSVVAFETCFVFSGFKNSK